MTYRVNGEKNLAPMIKTILPSLPRAVKITQKMRSCYHRCIKSLFGY